MNLLKVIYPGDMRFGKLEIKRTADAVLFSVSYLKRENRVCSVIIIFSFKVQYHYIYGHYVNQLPKRYILE